MAVIDHADVAARLKRLADELEAKGRLRDPAWRQAFLAVQRHVFVPRFWHEEEPGAFPARWRMIDRATADFPQWLDAVYSNRTLATELTGLPATDGPGMHPQVTSSSTLPGLVMAMLHALDVRDGMDVLEIGTGTGYNAALLSERLGSEHVTTVDVNPELTALARVRLRSHGYDPHVVTGDGAAGTPDRAPFDRIIATCGMQEVPQAWIDQTRNGGKILVNVLGAWNQFALVLLEVHGDTASGRFQRQWGGFMPHRTDPHIAHDHRVTVRRPAGPDALHCHSPLDPNALYDDTALGLIAQVSLGDVISHKIYVDGTDLATEIGTRDGESWAVVRHTSDGEPGFRVSEGGSRRLWREIETLHRTWVDHGEPAHDRYGITIDGEKTVLWLDRPDGRN